VLASVTALWTYSLEATIWDPLKVNPQFSENFYRRLHALHPFLFGLTASLLLMPLRQNS
jgi:hypothetical protein